MTNSVIVSNVRDFKTKTDITDEYFTFPAIPGDLDANTSAKWKVMYTGKTDEKIYILDGYEFTPGSTVKASEVLEAINAGNNAGRNARFFIHCRLEKNAVCVVKPAQNLQDVAIEENRVDISSFIREVDMSDFKDGAEVSVSVVGGGGAGGYWISRGRRVITGESTEPSTWNLWVINEMSFTGGGGAGGVAEFKFIKSADMSKMYVFAGWGSGYYDNDNGVVGCGDNVPTGRLVPVGFVKVKDDEDGIMMSDAPCLGFPSMVWFDYPLTEDGLLEAAAVACGGGIGSCEVYEGAKTFLSDKAYRTIKWGLGGSGGTAKFSADERLYDKGITSGEKGGEVRIVNRSELPLPIYAYCSFTWVADTVKSVVENGYAPEKVYCNTTTSGVQGVRGGCGNVKYTVNQDYFFDESKTGDPSDKSGAGADALVGTYPISGGGASNLGFIFYNTLIYESRTGYVKYYTDFFNENELLCVSYGGGSPSDNSDFSDVQSSSEGVFGGGGSSYPSSFDDVRNADFQKGSASYKKRIWQYGGRGGNGAVIIQYTHKPIDEGED